MDVPARPTKDEEKLMWRVALVGIICLLTGTWAHGQISSFTVSAGYSNVQISHNGGLFYTRDGGYVDGEVLWRLPTEHVPLLVGASLSGSTYYDWMHVPVTFSDGSPGFVRLESDLGFVSLEARAAVPISFAGPGGRGFFVVPKIGAGLLVDSYAIDNTFNSGGFTFVHTSYHDGAAFDIRPGIQGGYSWGWGSAGIDASYMAAFGDFGRLGSVAQEVRIGAFFRVKF
jgi:hypothetical protein